MYVISLIFSSLLGLSLCTPQTFETKSFKVGIEYENSLPMCGGSDRYRHRNNYDPFFVTVTTTAKKGYVFSYIEITGAVDDGGVLDFNLIKGNTGSKTVVFQLVSNRSDFLKYSYLAYGIKEEEYKKISEQMTLGPILNNFAVASSGSRTSLKYRYLSTAGRA